MDRFSSRKKYQLADVISECQLQLAIRLRNIDRICYGVVGFLLAVVHVSEPQ